VQRKLLNPPDFPDPQTLERQLIEFQSLYERRAKPFEWKLSRDDLNRLLLDIIDQQMQEAKTAA
jgi:hypothetical protein